MKIIKWGVGIACVLILFLTTNLQPAAAGTAEKEIDLATYPEKMLFDISNMKPGDWSVRDLKVMNNGTQDFTYNTAASFTSGSKSLYNELLLTVRDGSTVLYKGKLADFEKLDTRKLASKTNETLNFRVDFPAKLGNDFQGLKCSFQLKFYTENTGGMGSIIPTNGNGSGGVLPNTGTNIYNYLVSGIILLLIGTSMYVYRRNKLPLGREK